MDNENFMAQGEREMLDAPANMPDSLGECLSCYEHKATTLDSHGQPSCDDCLLPE